MKKLKIMGSYDDIHNILTILNEKLIQIKLLKETKNKNKFKILKLRAERARYEKFKEILFTLSAENQTKIKEYIEHIVTLALKSVMGDSYSFELDFDTTKRGQSEVHFFINDGINRLEPRDDTTGYGIVDICDFALRLIFLSMEDVEPILILDEPFKNVSPKYLQNTGKMLSEISKMLGIQIIAPTNIASEEFIELADNIIYINEKS